MNTTDAALTSNTPPLLNKISSVIGLIVPIASFFLLSKTLSPPALWVMMGVLLGLPSGLSLFMPRFNKWAQLSSTIALIAIVVIASADLWHALLNQVQADLSFQLLSLILALLIAAVLQLTQLLYSVTEDEMKVHDLTDKALSGPSLVISFSIGLILTSLMLSWMQTTEIALMSSISPKFLTRGVIPPLTLTLFFWGALLLFGKWLKMLIQVKHSDSARSHFNTAHQKTDTSVKKQDEFFQLIWQQFEASYTLPRYINWAIPILGFIGTVLGISLATEGLSAILANNDSEFNQLLGSALSPLGIAFDTTLIALSLSIALAFSQTILYRWEEKQLLILEEKLK